MTRISWLLTASFLLFACTSPEERCIADAMEGLAEIDAEIAETQANLERGYRLQDRTIDTVGLKFCSPLGSNGSLCLGGTKDIEPKQVPIDRAAEQARLNQLLSQRNAMMDRANTQLEACRSLT